MENTSEAVKKALKKKNRWKVIRTILESLVMLLALVWVVTQITAARQTPPVTPSEEKQVASIHASEGLQLSSKNAAGYKNANAERDRFICISYNGITERDTLDSKVVSQKDFNAQIAALMASGYQTITQQDIIDCWENGKPLPEKALFLLFEDGIFRTTNLAQNALNQAGYTATICTYANNLGDPEGHYITAENLGSLLENNTWQLGSNGYQLSYINIFDRYGNYFGKLNLDEFLVVDEYLKRDYNHYLMDFIRDKDRLRLETEEEMQNRIAEDYRQMKNLYQQALGYIPPLYVLMHSNTRAFGNDPLVSNQNRDHIQELFSMNFNRQGTCLNTTAASIYDLSRLQSRSYFSTNHLMMRIWDDTGDDVVFTIGDISEAANWYMDNGVAEFADDNKIILTTTPHGLGRLVYREAIPKNLDISVTLQGNLIGRQSIFLRAAQDSGIEITMQDNVLSVRENGSNLFDLDLFTFDGGPFISIDEDEWRGKVALQQAIIEFDSDPIRVAKAEEDLEKLKTTPVRTLEYGGEPYYPALDISNRGNRDLRILLTDNQLTLWLDGTMVADSLTVSTSQQGSIILEAEVSNHTERFSQANLDDDVYDAVFLDLTIRSAEDGSILHSYAVLPEAQTIADFLIDRYKKLFNFTF